MRQAIAISTLVLLCSFMVGPTTVLAQSDQGTATATIEAALTINNQTDLDFGAFTAGLTIGTVEIDPVAGGTTTTGGVTTITPGVRGEMLVNGNPSTNIFANLTNVSIGLLCTNAGSCGSQSLIATLLLDTPTQTDGGGNATIGVGGSLSVRDLLTNPAGPYSGTYEVNANY